MNALPNLAGVATADLVQNIGTGKFTAAYINWARTVQMLREKAPGWMPELVKAPDGGVLHRAPVGGHLLIRFRHLDGTLTPEVPQAVMDHQNHAIAYDKITARDVSDTHRRGVCMAAAFTFGLAYELWAKMPLESGYPEETPDESQSASGEDFAAAITAATDEPTLTRIGKELAGAGLPSVILKGLRELYSTRHRELKEAA